MYAVKKWQTNAIIAVVSTLGGVALGAISASRYWGWFMTYELSVRTQADIVERVAALERLRSGRSDEAIRILEIVLDGDLVTAGALLNDGHEFDPNVRHALEIEAQARKASSYEPDPTVRAAVQKALSLLHVEAGAAKLATAEVTRDEAVRP